MTLIQLLQSGGVLRYRPPYGFYVVKAGQTIQIATGEAKRAVSARQVLPAGIAGHGVYVFSLNTKAVDVRRVQDSAKALPRRPATAPPAQPDVLVLRRETDPKNAAAVPGDSRDAQAAQPGIVGVVDDAGARRAAAAGAGKGDCMGCGAGASQEVTAC